MRPNLNQLEDRALGYKVNNCAKKGIQFGSWGWFSSYNTHHSLHLS